MLCVDAQRSDRLNGCLCDWRRQDCLQRWMSAGCVYIFASVHSQPRSGIRLVHPDGVRPASQVNLQPHRRAACTMMRRSIDAISVLSDDLADYDIISDGQRSLESSITDLGGTGCGQKLREPPSTEEAKDIFRTAGSSADEIQDYVQRSLGGTRLKEGVARVYVDGFWDKLQTRCVSCEVRRCMHDSSPSTINATETSCSCVKPNCHYPACT